MDREALELEKLKKEIANLDAELRFKRHATWRWTITAISIVAGIVLTVFQIGGTLKEIEKKETQLKLEAQARTEESKARAQEILIRSQQIFISEVLERIVGIRSMRCRPGMKNGKKCGDIDGFTISEYEMYPLVAQEAVFLTAISLMDEFETLCGPSLSVLEKHAERNKNLKGILERSECYKKQRSK